MMTRHIVRLPIYVTYFGLDAEKYFLRRLSDSNIILEKISRFHYSLCLLKYKLVELKRF